MEERLVIPNRRGDLLGVIRHRLLINRWADPDEVVRRLPDGLRPHVASNGGVIVGCCLIAIEAARPWPMPAAIGRTIHAAAHRISVQVGSPDAATTAVFVPMRHSDSRPTVVIGGRLFPGVHRRSTVTVACSDERVHWEVRSPASPGRHGGADDGFGISATASRIGASPAVSEVADIVIGSHLGISPDHRGRLEGAEMRPASMSADELALTELRSDFLDSFHSAEEAETLLMTDVEVTWRRASVHGSGTTPVVASPGDDRGA